jgi:hypothetical protein
MYMLYIYKNKYFYEKKIYIIPGKINKLSYITQRGFLGPRVIHK